MAQNNDIYVIGGGGKPTPSGPGKKLWILLLLVLIILGIGAYFLFFNDKDNKKPLETATDNLFTTAGTTNTGSSQGESQRAGDSVVVADTGKPAKAISGEVSNISKGQETISPQSPPKVVLEEQVFFALNSATLDNLEAGKIELMWEKIKNMAGDFLIEGHTCDLGTDEYNMELSLNRAQAVVQQLQNLGLTDKFNVEAKAWGKTKPKSENTSAEGRGKNRRVEITFKSK